MYFFFKFFIRTVCLEQHHLEQPQWGQILGRIDLIQQPVFQVMDFQLKLWVTAMALARGQQQPLVDWGSLAALEQEFNFTHSHHIFIPKNGNILNIYSTNLNHIL